MRYIFTIFAIVSTMKVGAQVKNNQWVFGYGDNISLLFGMSSLEFDYPNIHLSPYEFQNKPSWMSVGSTFVCDLEGKIALISDNCSIYDHEFNIIEGGANMHESELSKTYCKNDDKSFGNWKTNILFTSSTKTDTYFHIYKDLHVVDSLFGLSSLNLMFNVIEKNEDGNFYISKHDTVSKNKYQIISTPLPIHNEGKWYFQNVNYNSNTYNTFILNELNNIIDTSHSQNIGENLDRYNVQASGGLFSPDLKTFSTIISGKGLMVFDFDVKTQLYSNERIIYFPTYPEFGRSIGMTYSSNSRFVYIPTLGYDAPEGNTCFLYQIDLQLNTYELIATFFEPDEIGWPIGMGSITQGPDCRMYISPGSTTHFMHTIHHPNRKGPACTFQPLAIDLPTRVSVTLPTFITSGADCDSTYNWPFKPLANHKSDDPAIVVSLYPNPISDHLFLRSESVTPDQWTLTLYDTNGRQVSSQKGISAPVSQLYISHLMPGIYYYKISDKAGKAIVNGKVVKN